MNSRSAIFTVTLVLLVPLGYSSFSANEACAAAPDPKYGSKNSTCKAWNEWKTCCWLTGEGLNMKCQQCFKDDNGDYTICGSVWDVQAKKAPEPGEIVPDTGDPTIKDPPTSSEPKVPREDILPDETDEDEPTINDPPTTTEPKNLDPGKIEVPNLK